MNKTEISEEVNIKFLTVNVHCTHCNHLVMSRSVIANYGKHLSTKELDKEVLASTPKNIRCKKCNSKHHNEIGYGFYHQQKIR